MWRTIRIKEEAYNIIKKIAKEEGKSMCEVLSEIVTKQGGNNIKEGEIGLEAKAALSVLIAELDLILRDTRIPAERKVEKIEALLYTWIVANKLPVWEVRRENGFVMIEVSENVGEVADNAQREVSDNYREQDRRRD